MVRKRSAVEDIATGVSYIDRLQGRSRGAAGRKRFVGGAVVNDRGRGSGVGEVSSEKLFFFFGAFFLAKFRGIVHTCANLCTYYVYIKF